ncbi:MAG: two-component sensor histidine kinase, partial [Tardiphaga sp.]
MLRRPDSALSAPLQGGSVRFRLLAIALLPMLVILPLLLGVAVARWNEKFNATLISKVNGDLTIAHQYLARMLEYTSEHLQALGLSARFRDVAATEDHAGLTRLLENSRKTLELDFLYLTNEAGKLIASSPRISLPSIRSDWPVVLSALKG